MPVGDRLRRATPAPLRHTARKVVDRLPGALRRSIRSAAGLPDDKYDAELRYWEGRWAAEGHRFGNGHYRDIMLGMAGEAGDAFVAGKIVADFGCGPRGSLEWAKSARARIGIDVLADEYAKRFRAADQNMIYVCATERTIPLPSDYVDILFTMNAMDHVHDFAIMAKEVLRTVRPSGDFIASFNIDEPPTASEPQTLTEAMVRQHLLDHMSVLSYRLAAQGPRTHETYRHFFDGSTPPTSGDRYLWVRARKP